MKNKLSNKALASLMVVGMTLPNTTIVNAVNESEQDSAIIENNDSLDNQINEETQETQSEQNVDEVEENQNASNEESQTREVIGQTKFVDENGNIKTVDVYDGTTGEEYNPNARTVNTANMVNFNCSKAGVTTKYIDYYTGKEGYLSKTSAADAAFLGTENGKIKFMISGVTGLVDSQYVEVVSQGTYYASNYEVNSRGKLYHYISNNVNATGNEGNFNYVGAGPSYLTKGVEYYSYDGHYFYTDYNVMIDDYKHNIRSNSVNPNNPYYNYYQYLPLRSKTNVSADELTAYINNKASSVASKMNNIGSSLVKYQNQYGVNALLVIGLAALESNWGKSNIAVNKNNIFGIGAFDTDPYNNAYSFNSVDDCIKELMSNYMSKGYLNTNYSNFRGGYLGDKASGIFVKYSSDPYEGEKIGNIAAQIDENYNSKDKNQYTIGIKDASMTTSSKVSVYRDANNSTKLYDTIANQSYAFIIRKKDSDNGYYQVQSDSTLNADRTATTRNSEYDYDENYGYVNKNSLTIINTGNDVKVNQAPVIESAEVTDVTEEGYTVACKITDDGGLSKVLMPTWTEKNGQDDLKWYTASKNGDTYTLKVKTSNHNNEGGTYYTHIYAYDAEGKQAKKELTISVPEQGKPEIKDVKVSKPTRSGYTVTCTVASSTTITKVLMPTWTENNGQDDLVWHNAKVESQGNGKYKVSYTVDPKDHKNESGKYVTHIYAYNKAGKEACYQITEDIEVPENQAPVIESAEVTDVTEEGYTVACKITDDGGLSKVLMPTWTEKNGQDDLKWYTASKNGDTYTLKVKTSNHNNEGGTYYTHIYAYDAEGKQAKKELTISVPEQGKPEIKDVKVSKPTRSGYTVTCTVASSTTITKVLMPTWTENNGQDDLVWHNAKVESQGNGKYKVSYTVDPKDHKNESGKYVTHIYAYNKAGKEACYQITEDIEVPENQAPVIESAEVTDVTEEGYTVACKITDDGGLSKVLMPTWTEKNGQDDLKWYTASKNGDTYTLKVKTSNHNNEGGTYYTHIYAYDAEGKQAKKELTISVPEQGKPEIKDVKVSKPTRSGYTVTCTVASSTTITKVLMPTWTENNGQDDLVWHNAKVESQGNGKYKVSYTVDPKDHKNESGKYVTHIYAYNKAGKEACYQITEDIEVPENQAPVIESAEVTDVTEEGYTVACKITDDGGLSKVLMPTWTEKNGQDDLKWYTASKNGDTYTLKVKTSNHNNEGGTYYTHIYAYDAEGKQAKKELTISVPEQGKPEIKDVKVSKPTRSGYTVTCTVASSTTITKVLMPTWTENNGQDDLVWHNAKVESQGNGKYKVSYTVDPKDHKNESGKYVTHIYAYNKAGKEACYQITEDIEVPENQAPVIESAEVTDVTRKKFKVSAKVTDDRKVSRVLAAVWTEKNGQDDLKWYTLQNNDGLYYLDISMEEHNYETGSVNVHVYAYDDEGKEAKKKLIATVPKNQAPVITNVNISNITNDSYKVTCNVSDDLKVTSVKMPTWTEKNGQDDIVWHEATINNGIATFTVNRKDHNFEYGQYITHIYAYDADGGVGFVGCDAVNLTEPTDGKPIIKNVYITDANDDGYTITCEVSSNDTIRNVLIPTWTYKNGQDDIVWHNTTNLGNGKYSCRILRRDHKSEFGTYISHIYAYTTTGIENHIELNYHNIVNTTVAQGWTYINGEKYFFDNKGNMVGNMPCKKVVDVSSYNGNIDWETAAKYGDIDGVIIRIVNHPNGSYQEDPQFAKNLAACRKYNIPFGVYIYDYSHNTGDAYNEADLVMSILRKYNVSTSELKYNIYFDMERKQSDTGLNSQQMSDVAATFINRVSNYGYRAYIYSYRSLLNEYLNTPYIWSQTNWLAAYTNTMGWNNPYYHGSFGWQYTSGGVIPGFNGNNGYVDVSCWFEI